MRSAVFLDRDGVLNEVVLKDGRPTPPADARHLEIIDGAAEACRQLKSAGFLLIVVTNQPDIRRGKTSRERVDEINDALRKALPLDDIRVCPHDDGDRCACRKPRPGLITDAARDWNIGLESSFVVGDRWRDIEAGTSAGCRTVFIDRNYLEKRPESFDHCARSLAEAVPMILENTKAAGDAP